MCVQSAISFINWLDQYDDVRFETPELPSSAVSRMSPENLTLYHHGSVWRVEADSLQDVFTSRLTVFFSTPRTINFAAFSAHYREDDAADVNFQPAISASDLIRFELSTSVGVRGSEDPLGHDSDWHTSDMLPEYQTSFTILHRTQSVVRVDFSFKSGPGGLNITRDFARLWFDDIQPFEVSHNWGSGWMPLEDIYEQPIRGFRLQYSHIRDSELSVLKKRLFQTQKRRQVFVIPDLSKRGEGAFCRRSGRGDVASRYSNASSYAANFLEDLAGD